MLFAERGQGHVGACLIPIEYLCGLDGRHMRWISFCAAPIFFTSVCQSIIVCRGHCFFAFHYPSRMARPALRLHQILRRQSELPNSNVIEIVRQPKPKPVSWCPRWVVSGLQLAYDPTPRCSCRENRQCSRCLGGNGFFRVLIEFMPS